MSNNIQKNTTSALHNVITEAGGKDHPLMLAPKTVVLATSSTDDAPPTRESRVKETYATVLEEIKKKIDADIEAQAENINKQDVETNLYWEFRKFTSKDSELFESCHSRSKNVDNTLRSDRRIGYDRQTRQYENQRVVNVVWNKKNLAKECKKSKRPMDSSYHKENMLMCKQQEAKVQISVEQYDWVQDSDEEEED
ncbi:hypothetical protein Tco_0497508 [Tanacetum coccineum]